MALVCLLVGACLVLSSVDGEHSFSGVKSFLEDLYHISAHPNSFSRSNNLQRSLQALINVQVGTTETHHDTNGEPESSEAKSPGVAVLSVAPEPPELVPTLSEHGGTSNIDGEPALEEPNSADSQNDEKTPGVSPQLLRPRIIYIRDFGAIASHSKELIGELILAVRTRRLALQTDSDSTDSYEGAKIQRTAIVLGVAYSPEDPPHARSASRTWEKFEDGFATSETEDLCRLLPDIRDEPIPEAFTDDAAEVLVDALSTAPNRVRNPERTWFDPDTGSASIYRQIICAYGFSDSRDPLVRSKKSGKRVVKPDINIWRKGLSMAQKEREEELGMMRLMRNDRMVRKALSARGARVQEGVGVFSALPEEYKLDQENAKVAQSKSRLADPKQDKWVQLTKKTKKIRKEEREEEATVAAFKENILTRTFTDRIAAFALRGLVAPGSETPTTKYHADQTSTMTTMTTAATIEAPTVSPRIVSPQELADAIRAILVDLEQREEWLNDYIGLTTQDNLLDPKSDSSEENRREDPILAKVRASGELNTYEQTLLGGVIDTSKSIKQIFLLHLLSRGLLLSSPLAQLTTTFEDVCVDPKVIDSVRSIISLPLMYPTAFASGILGAEALSGILLYGPPGTGKTMLCRAVAKECGVRMLLVTPSAVQDMYVGETEKLVKAVFTLARKIAPCVIFIDEVDAIFGSRSSGESNGAQYHRSMLTEFMTEMDGLNSASVNKKKGIVVIGATNRPFDLDDAILRRLPRRMLIDLPGIRERERT